MPAPVVLGSRRHARECGNLRLKQSFPALEGMTSGWIGKWTAHSHSSFHSTIDFVAFFDCAASPVLLVLRTPSEVS